MKLTDMIKLGVKGFKPSEIKQINESGISTDEVIKLAENGYSVSEVNELISLADNETVVQPGNDDVPQDNRPDPDTSGHDGDNAGINKQIESQTQEIEKLKERLKAAQKENTSRNLGPQEVPSNEDTIKNIFKDLY